MAEADALEPPSENPFDQIGEDKASDNPFDAIGPSFTPATSKTGSFVRRAAGSVLPAAGGLAAMGAGAEALGGAGAALGGPVGGVVGAIVGGFGGAYLGAEGVSAAQHWALSKLPDSWREAIGQDDRQQRVDEGEHPVASFLGGLAPYAVTMKPGLIAKTDLPQNATAMQRIMANPATARLFGGAAMGGMELGQEAAHGESPDWTKVAISTGFGLVFNKPTKIGEAITELGAKPTRRVLGRPDPTQVASAVTEQQPQGEVAPEQPEAAPPAARQTGRIPADLFEDHPPTVAQAGDAKVMGPGVTEEVFHGTHEQDPPSALTAQDNARTEQATIGEPRPGPDIHDVARRLDPETFEKYAELQARNNEFEARLAEHPEDAVAQQHLAATQREIGELAPQIAAGYRRAADAAGAPSVEPSPAEAAPLTARSIEDQRAFISSDVTQKLIAAGRPAEEAKAAGALVAARYEARAGRFRGALGSPEDLYRREGAEIQGPRVPAGVAPTGRPAVDTVLAKPEVAAAIVNPKINRKDDVPYGAGPNKANDGVTNVDRHVPEQDTIQGKTYDPAVPVAIHEQVEKAKMEELTKAGMPDGEAYKIAHHDFAEVAEHAWVYDNIGPGAWGEYQKHWASWLEPIEHENPKSPPPDLYAKPYPHDDVHLARETKEEKVLTPKASEDFSDEYERRIKTHADEGIYSEEGNLLQALQSARGVAYSEKENLKGVIWASKNGRADIVGRLLDIADRAGTPEYAAQAKRAAEFNGYKEDEFTTKHVTKTARGPRARDPETWSLLEFIASRGGIRPDDPNIADLRASIGRDNKFIPGFGPLIRKGGKYLDQQREAAVEAGYIQDRGFNDDSRQAETTVNSLLEAADTELRGNKVYKSGYFPEAERQDPAEREHQMIRALDSALSDVEIPPESVTGALRDRVLQIMDKEHVSDPLEAYEKAVTEEIQRHADDEHIERIPDEIPGWDVPHDAGATSEAGGTAAEVARLEDARAGEAQRSTGESDREAAEREIEFFQRKPRGLPGQTELPGTGPASDAELAQRRSDEALKPKAEQKPADFGLFGDSNLQKELFQPRLDFKEFIAKQKREVEAIKLQLEGFDKNPRYELKDGEKRALLSKNIGGDGAPYRITEFDERGPWGHFEVSSLDEAAREIRSLIIHGYEPVGHENPIERVEFEQGARGKIRMAEGRRPIITLMKDANASTFIHESGHQWLEELMRDAEHPQAPDILKDDATTVRDWLGVQGTEDIKTRHHEKFARGFEQYLREGIAPSPTLANVFAKFKNWLLSIYQSIKGLGSPINDDIRGVFDRMLAEEPQRTVIAPERPGGPTLADIHDTDAALTEPHEAEAASDRIAAETGRYVQDPPPEIAHEITTILAKVEETRNAGAEPGTETTGGAEQRGEVGGGGSEPGTVPTGGGVGEGGGEVVSSGTETAPESGTAAGAEQRPDARKGAGNLAPGPATVFGPKEYPFLDKAGNIRVENLTTSEDVAKAIHDAADANDDFIGDRRGVVTDGQVMELAEALGMDYDKLNTRKIGQAFNAEQVVAARKLLIQSATNVSDLMKRAAIGSDEDVMNYAVAKDRHQMIQAQVAGITAEAGRALRAFRSIVGEETAQATDQFIKGATGKTLYQLRMEAKLGAQLDTPGKVSKYLQDAQKRTFGKMVLEYWINGLISGPATHTTYMVGNAILAAEKAGPETAAAALIGNLRKAMGREGETVRLGEVGAQFRGAVKGLPGAVEASLEAMRSGMTTLLPGETSRPLIPFSGDSGLVTARNVGNEQVHWADVGAQAFGLMRGLRDGITSGAELIRAGGVEGAPAVGFSYSPLGSIPDIAVRGVPVVPLGSAIRLPGRFIAAIHSFFRSVNYSMDKSALAYRAASEEGLTGNAFDARVGDIWQNPSEEVMEKSRFQATELTLMGQGSEFVKALGRLTNMPILGFPFFKFIDPFVHIAGNIIDQSIIQRTPVGLLAPEIRADIMGKNGNIAQDMAMARMLAGTALSITFGGLASQGLASGSGPSDPRKSAMWRLAGNQAHSVRIADVWYDVHRLGPMGMLLGVAADMYEVAHTAEKGELLEAGAHLQHAITQNILDESFMRGPSELIRAIEDPGRYGAAYLRNFVSSFVPFSVGMSQMARAADPYSRQARTVMDAIKNKVPGLSETLWPRRDVWGEEMHNPEAVGMKGVTAIYERQMSHDPVNLAMLDLGIAPAQVTRKIRNVDLTEQQYDDFARTAGRMTKMRLDAIAKSPDYGTWPNHIKATVIQEVIRQSREAARGIVMMKYPQIVRDAVDDRLKKARGEKLKAIE